MKAPRGLERLYAVAPAEFTRARNALAAELRAAGDAEGAREVARLRRPSAPLWAVNQLARSARQPLEKFLDAVEHLRRTQLSDARGATEAMRKQREYLDALVARAAAALREAGVRTSAETTRRLSGMLLGAAVEAAHAAELRAGRLTEEPAAPGFDAFAGAPRGAHLRLVPRDDARTEAARPRGGAATRDGHDAARAKRQDARAERERERARQAEARQRAAEDKQRQAEERRREAERRAAEVAALERDAKAARERLAEIDRRLSEARRAARASRGRRSGGGRRASPP